MEFIKDLGTRVRIGGGTKRWGLYRCPECLVEYERVSATVEYSLRNGKATICRNCTNKLIAVNASESRTKTLEQFILDARAVHGDLYTYDKVDYNTSADKVLIGCQYHDDYLQKPRNHLRGEGCPECARERNNVAKRVSISNNLPTTLYYVYFPELNLWKVGCTTKSITERFSRDSHLEIQVLYSEIYEDSVDAYTIESNLLKSYLGYKVGGKPLKSKGNSELLTQPIENIEQLIANLKQKLKDNHGIR